ncbi:FAD-binding domain-containing protein [Amniculicola lignicola CBS 123094]|uniref:FAD-binding domain-containing protein n=1 Tax=Amniculicola lignicola CBS 123094 TaxID=1392246 RepID=A0A6A5VVQ7_9PLEO|nr:FAD-binding domain-containing protein [Amniculicola lignicola CBS 123094]
MCVGIDRRSVSPWGNPRKLRRGLRGAISGFLFFLIEKSESFCVASQRKPACTLSKALPGKIFFGGNAQYDESISSYFYIQERSRPACGVVPTSSGDVSVAIKLLAKSGSPFSVRSGGHASQPGASNSKNGVIIDLRSLKEIKLQKNGAVVSAGSGAAWGDVYGALDSRGLAVLGGRDAHVGVSGFTLGGGISFFSPQRGFACDSVTNFEIVLANGKIVEVSAISNQDLFVALKGGTNNFGVVTRFSFKTFTQGQLWGGAIVYPDSAFPKMEAAFTQTKQPKNFDLYQALEASFVYLGQSPSFLGVASLFYSKPVVNATSLKPFTSIQPQLSNSMRLSSPVQLAREVSSLSTPNLSSVWATTTFEISPTIISRLVSIWKKTARSMTQVTTTTASMTFQSIPPPPQITSPNVLGYSPFSSPQKDQVLMLLSTFFEDAAAYEDIDALTKTFFAAVDNAANEEGVDVKYTYLNYAAKWQTPLKDYGTVNWLYLAAISKKYDPTGVFQKKVGGFKI